MARPREPAPEDANWFDRWMQWRDWTMEYVGGFDVYGVTSQMPQGYMYVKYQWDSIAASQRYDASRRLGSLIRFSPEMVQFLARAFDIPDPDSIVDIDIGLSGKGGGHTWQFSYGVTDAVDFYFDLPFTYMDVSMKPFATRKDGTRVDVDQLVCGLTEGTTREPFATRYKSDWVLGDINAGFSWNIFRTNRFAGALTPRVFFPTGRVADPDNSLLYATGTEIETSIGGWAVGATQGYDIRIFKYSHWIDIVASTELSFAYAFAQQRKYPEYMLDLDAGFTMTPVNTDSNTFTYIPGWSLEWTAQLTFGVALFGISAGFGAMHMQTPEIHGDWDFVRRVQALELVGSQTTWVVQVATSVTLLPLGVPLELGFSWRKVVDGFNALVFDDWFQVVVKAYLPTLPRLF